MTEQEHADMRVLRWRAEGLVARTAQAVLLAGLCWLLTSHAASLAWMAAAIVANLLDTALCSRLVKAPGNRLLHAACVATMALSAATFSAVGFVILAYNTSIGLTGAALALCAIGLNNAVMSRGSRAYSMALAGPSSTALIALPVTASAFGHPLTAGEVALLTVGAVGYTVFIVRLAATLQREAEVVQFALESQERQRDFARGARRKAEEEGARWSLVFNQSPLAQVCFDASRLHQALVGDDTAVGGRIATLFADAEQAFGSLTLTDANEAALALFGVEHVDDHVPARHFGAPFVGGFLRAMNEADGHGALPPFDAEIVRGDGRAVDVRVHIRTAPDNDRPWALCMATFVDMTEIRRAADALREAVQEAQAANQAKSDFLAIMSHEIRTPLNGILGMAQAIVHDRLTPAQRARVEVVRTSGHALLAILNDVLDLSKIEAGRLELEAAPFDLGELAENARMAFAALANEKGLDFTLAISEAARGVFEGDAVRVRQIVLNLISNAVKFTAEGGVTLAVDADEAGVRIAVSDTGGGIAPDRIGRLFEKFVQEDSSTTRRFGGTGLGLSISRELCAAMGGAIDVDSVPGMGSTFTVSLPLRRVEPAAGQRTDGTLANAFGADRVLRILAAEDNAINQLVLKTLLEQAGVAPVIVGDGAAALAAWESGAWDVILMDVQMPVMDGPTATARIRAGEAATGRPRTPIIALTANAMSHQTEAYLASGMDGFVAKPIEIARLYEAINAAMAKPDAAGVDAAANG